MKSDRKGDSVKKTASPEFLVGTATIVSLILIGLLAVLEQGPPSIMIYTGASPLNTGLLGTSDLYLETKSIYPNTYVITNWSTAKDLLASCKNAVVITISPEIPYSDQESLEIAELLSSCMSWGLFIADESGNANKLLEAVGSRIRVEGTRILDASTRLPYPTAIFNTSWGYRDSVLLDIASPLIVLSPGNPDHEILVSGIVPAAYIVNQSGAGQTPIQSISFEVPVSFEEGFGNTRVFILGDGSVFLNQVIRSQYRDKYLDLYIGVLKHLCNDQSACIVLMDASKYIGGDPASLISRGVNPSLLVTPEFIAAAIARILHPATWLPPMISWADSSLQRLMIVSNLMKILVICLSVLVVSLVILSKTPPRRVDEPIEAEGTWYRRMLIYRDSRSRSEGLGRKEFLEIYRAIDEIIHTATGARLSEPSCGEKLAGRGVDRDLAYEFCRYMRRTAMRAMLRRPYPLFLRWDRAIERAIDLYYRVSTHIKISETVWESKKQS